MKTKAIIIIGFALATIGFLLLFKYLFLVNISPNDELAPGIVVLMALICGSLCAFISHKIQKYFHKN